MVNDPADGTAFLISAVASFVRIVQKTSDVADTRLLVTTTDVPPAAIFTVPDVLLIVCAPVVPVGVLVALKIKGSIVLTRNTSASRDVVVCRV